jgi:hypothetical protein
MIYGDKTGTSSQDHSIGHIHCGMQLQGPVQSSSSHPLLLGNRDSQWLPEQRNECLAQGRLATTFFF